MERGHRVFCILCKRSEETKITGPLSSKGKVTAHQNCLLFSSGICCEESPQEDDLFGFSVDDVLEEVRRGKMLKCSYCLRSGATSGCEFRPCKKSYHYPCAVEAEAEPFENVNYGTYGIYCSKHCGLQNDSGSANGRTSSKKNHAAPRNPSEAGARKVNFLSKEDKEGEIAVDSSSSRPVLSYPDKPTPSSQKDTNEDSSGAGPSVCNSDRNSSSSKVSKRALSSDDDEEVNPARNKSKRRMSENPLNSADEFITNSGTLMFPPIEDDDCYEFSPDSTLIRNDAESPAGSGTNQGSGNPPEDKSKGGDRADDDEHSDDESQSLLIPVEVCIDSQASMFNELSTPTESAPEREEERKEKESSPDGQTAAPSVPLHSATPLHGSKPHSVTGSTRRPSSPISPSLLPSTPSPEAPPPDHDPDPDPVPNPEPSIDSASFWRNCNAAGCTKAMFSDFMKEMNEISERIQTERASQTDYDRALKVMTSSGQLENLVTKQQKELQRKQRELEKAAAAMSEVVSALQR